MKMTVGVCYAKDGKKLGKTQKAAALSGLPELLAAANKPAVGSRSLPKEKKDRLTER